LLISTYDNLKPLNKIKSDLSQYVFEEYIHIWPYSSKLDVESNQFIRESLINNLAVDALIIPDLFEARFHIPTSINKFYSIPTYVVLHDLIPLQQPQTYLSNSTAREIYQAGVRDLKMAQGILCNSKHTFNEVVTFFPELEGACYFIGGGPSDKLSKNLGQKKEQIICILGDDPRKNLKRLLDGWTQLSFDIRKNYQLKVAGNFSPERIKQLKSNIVNSEQDPNQIIFLGDVDDNQLSTEIGSSFALIHPAIVEGLGMPILEAIHLGIPAICSNTSSMAEIGALGAIFDPLQTIEIAAALERIILDSDFRGDVLESQKEIIEKYNWSAVSRRTIQKITSDLSNFISSQNLLAPIPKIAVIAPGEEADTGIARFAHETSSLFSEYSEMSFFPSESLDDIQDALHMLDTFDLIIVHLGNSKHHKNAFKIVANIPTIVIAHDVKFGHTIKDLYLADKNWMPEFKDIENLEGEILNSRSIRRIFSLALGIVVHTKSAQQFLETYQVPSSQILIVQFPSYQNSKYLSIEVAPILFDNRIVCPGFITVAKLPELIIEAVEIANKQIATKLEIVFAGLADRSLNNRLLAFAHKHGVKISITGYQSLDQYFQTIQKSNIAIQLRSTDSGESSASIMDLLSSGIPTIVNNFGAFTDLPDSVVCKISSQPTANELANAILDLQNRENGRTLSTAGLDFVKEQCSPKMWTANVLQFAQKRSRLDPTRQAILKLKIPKNQIYELSESISLLKRNNSCFGQNIVIASDIANLRKTEFLSGIQRATSEIHTALKKRLSGTSYKLQGIDLLDPLEREALTDQINRNGLVNLQICADPNAIDVLLLVDLDFEIIDSIFLQKFAETGRPIFVNLYDMLPFTNPEWFPEYAFKKHFGPWLKTVLRYASDVIVNSNVTLDIFNNSEFARNFSGETHVIPLASFANKVNLTQKRIKGQTLIVGTIEPRKGHNDVLNAFDEIISLDESITLHIVGRQGWLVESLIERITSHPELNKRLFWHSECDDEKLESLYSSSTLVICASKGEGFGLPLVEAFTHGSPVLARDIPVFREVAGSKAQYFSTTNELVSEWLKNLKQKTFDSSKLVQDNLTYDDYANRLFHLISLKEK
jgi:glycosyltransferase involved in cell wall biosynthesis